MLTRLILIIFILFSESTSKSFIASDAFRNGRTFKSHESACHIWNTTYSNFCFEGYGFKKISLVELILLNSKALILAPQKTYLGPLLLGFSLNLNNSIDWLTNECNHQYTEKEFYKNTCQIYADGLAFGAYIFKNISYQDSKKLCSKLNSSELIRICYFGLGRASFFKNTTQKLDRDEMVGYFFAKINAGRDFKIKNSVTNKKALAIVQLKDLISYKRSDLKCIKSGFHYFYCLMDDK